MKDKPKTPYQRLLDDIKEWALKVSYRHEKVMWLYPKGKLNTGWNLGDLYERVSAAEQLNYDVQLVATDEGLSVRYKKQTPSVPYSWR